MEQSYTNLKLFYKSFVCIALLQFKSITFCRNCDTVWLEESEIEEEDEGELNSIQCDTCAAWFHYKCENITTETNTSEWDCSNCLSFVINQFWVNFLLLDSVIKKSVYIYIYIYIYTIYIYTIYIYT